MVGGPIEAGSSPLRGRWWVYSHYSVKSVPFIFAVDPTGPTEAPQSPRENKLRARNGINIGQETCTECPNLAIALKFANQVVVFGGPSDTSVITPVLPVPLGAGGGGRLPPPPTRGFPHTLGGGIPPPRRQGVPRVFPCLLAARRPAVWPRRRPRWSFWRPLARPRRVFVSLLAL